MKPLTTFSLTALILAAVAAQTADRMPTARAGVLPGAPVVDGRLDDAVWDAAARLEPVVLLRGGPAAAGMTAHLGHDGTALCIAVRCPTPNPDALTAEATVRDGSVWMDESVEVFVDANRDFVTYHHFLINGDNVQRDERGDVTTSPTFDLDWDGPWESAVSKDAEAWCAEFRIPFETLGLSADHDRAIGLNIVRNDKANGEVVVWSSCMGTLHQPVRFGTAILSASPEPPPFDAALQDLGELGLGESRSSLALSNRSGKPGRLEWTVSCGGQEGVDAIARGGVDLEAGQSKTAEFAYEIDGYGLHVLSVVVSHPDSGRIVSADTYTCSIPILATLGFGGRLAAPEGVDLWWAPGAYKIRRDTAPPEGPAGAIRLSAAANEFEPVQVVFRPDADKQTVSLEVGELKGDAAIIPASAIEVRVVEYVDVETPTDAFGATGPYPDPLPLLDVPVAVAAGQNQPMWLLVHVPPGTPAGVYRGDVAVGAGQAAEQGWVVPMELRVRAFELTPETHTATAYGCSPDWTFLGVTARDDQAAVYDKYLACLRDHRIAPYRPMTYHRIEYRGARQTIQAGDLTLTLEDLFSKQYFEIAYRGKVLGRLTNTMTQFEKEGVGWQNKGVGWPGIDSIRADEVHRDDQRVVLDVTGLRGGSSPANRRYSIAFRFVIPCSGNWFAAKMLDLRNEDDVRFRADGYYYILNSDGGEKVAGPSYGGWVTPDGILGAVCGDTGVGFSMAPIYVQKSQWLEPGQGTGEYGPWMLFFVADGQDAAALEASAAAILDTLAGGSPETYAAPEGAIALTKDDPGQILFDFEAFDHAAEKYLDQWHFNAFNFGAVPGAIAGHAKGTPEYERLYHAIYTPMCEHLAERGWLDKAYCYWIDEPTEDQYAFVNEGMDLLKRHCPGLRRLLTEQPEPELFGHPNLWVPVLSAYDEADCRARQAAGDQVWWYVCCGPHAPYPNNFIDHPAINHRIRFWMLEKYGVTGSLYWATTYWRQKDSKLRNPWTSTMAVSPTGGTWGNGDGMLLYPACREPSDVPVLDGPVPSQRIEMLREGLEDREYFWLLKQAVEKLEAAAAANATGDRLEQCRNALAMAERAFDAPDRLAQSLTVYTKDPADLYEERDALADAIEAVQAALAAAR